MAVSQEDREKTREEVESLLTELSAIDTTLLGRRSELSPDINFEEVVPDFRTMIDVVSQLNDRDLSRIPKQELITIKNGLTKLKKQVQDVRDFTLQQENPVNVKDRLCSSVKGSYDGVVQPLMLVLAFTATQATDWARIEREAQGFHTRLREEYDAFHNTLVEQRKEAEQALAAVKEQASEAGVSTHAQSYLTQASTHGKAAMWWFWATVIAGATTFIAALAGVWLAVSYTPPGVPEAIQYVVAKLIVLSVLSFAIVWCARNYRSEKHNEMLNRHRANALGTYRTFVEGTQDIATRDAILLFCAQAAFAHRPSGFDTQEVGEHPTQIVNL